MAVYLLHFDRQICPGRHTTQHYLGFAKNLESRIAEHRSGSGSRLCAVAMERGISFTVARTWEGDRQTERQLKRRKGSPRLCPICRCK